jgi:hypothetical protein
MRFIVFGEDWGSHPSSTQHMFKIISKEHDVDWFNSVGMRTPSFNLIDIKRVLSKLKLMFNRKEKKEEKEEKEEDFFSINQKNPFLLPWHNNYIVSKFNKNQVKKEFLINEEPIVYWISVPTAISMINVREQDILIYYCGDDFSALEGVDYKLVKESEDKLKKRADYIFVASESLLKKINLKKSILLEHGVDFELFTKKNNCHKELVGLKNTIGYYGSISSWLDYNLLKKIAIERPNYNLILVGDIKIDISDLKKLKNVKHINAVDHNDLPSLSQHWDVSILPFLKNQQIEYCNPLKLKEYIAVGNPIVSTYFPATEKYKEVISIAKNNKDFLKKIDESINISNKENLTFKNTCQNVVRKNSWKNKVQFLIKTIRGYV